MESKRTFWRALGAVAIIALASLGMTACDMGVTRRDDVGGGHEPGFMGETLTLSDQVWLLTWNWDNRVEVPWTGSTGVVGRFYNMHGNIVGTGGSGSIMNGQLSFSIGTPHSLQTGLRGLFYNDGGPMFYNLQISETNVGFQLLILETTCGGSMMRGLYGGNIWEEALYIFVDRNVSITGTGRRSVVPCDCWPCNCVRWDGTCYCGGISITQNMHLNLRRGWNALHVSMMLGGLGGLVGTQTVNLTFLTGNPSHLRWVLERL